MTTFREKYSYAVDRHVGGFWYRYIDETEIRRSSTGPANFSPWKTFPSQSEAIARWRKICDLANAETVGRTSLSGATKETA